uniref:Uncharacterized protein n=1 Tax=Siphoviridae sp. ct7EW56 TaxID=2827562 RepID=A0A8S5LRT3_9CAUD|nr:MAG TPA: hypothetical protein [Siphoviridae sp. ct7EW56]
MQYKALHCITLHYKALQSIAKHYILWYNTHIN